MTAPRTKKMTDAGYFPTTPNNEGDVRQLYDDMYQEVFDNLNAGKAELSDVQGIVLGQIPDGTMTNAKFADFTLDQNKAAFSTIDGIPIAGITYSTVITGGLVQTVTETFTATSKKYREKTYSYTGSTLNAVRTKLYASDGTTVIKDYTDTFTFTPTLNTMIRTVN